MQSCDLQLLIRMCDEYLVALGTSKLVDGTKVRDQFLDLRSLMVSMTETVEEVPSV